MICGGIQERWQLESSTLCQVFVKVFLPAQIIADNLAEHCAKLSVRLKVGCAAGFVVLVLICWFGLWLQVFGRTPYDMGSQQT